MYSYGEYLSGEAVKILKGDQNTEGKYFAKTLTLLMAEIIFPGTTPGNLGKTGLKR